MSTVKPGQRTRASCTSCLLTACAVWRVSGELQHVVYSPVPARPRCGCQGSLCHCTLHEATHLNRGKGLQWLRCSASHAMQVIAKHGQQRLADHIWGFMNNPIYQTLKGIIACWCCAGDPRSPQGQRAARIVSELRNFAFCAYATNWRNYIDVEMTTDGSLMPLPGGTESTRRLAAVCVRT